MLLASAVLLLTAVAASASEDGLPWWKTASLYHIYPRSFYDGLGTGIGNLKGITKKAEYLKEIGVDALWFNPIFKSPMSELGYDVSDYRMVDPLFGTNEDLYELIEALHKLGIKILLDLVPNHTSCEHEWFKKSVKKEDPYTDYYLWVDAKKNATTGERMPPNNWLSCFEGGAWEWNDERQQYYLHQFRISMPDLNLRNPKVVKEIDDIMIFWMDKGLDGFRVDAVPFFFEDEQLRDSPLYDEDGDDISLENRPECYDLVHHWADVVYDYSQKDGKERVLYLEAYATLKKTMPYYGTGKESLCVPFNFFLQTNISQDTRPEEYKKVIMSWIDNMPAGAAANWVTGNHDRVRPGDLYGVGMIDAINLLTGVLPGVKNTYYGEEIGMVDTFVRYEQTTDTVALLLGRDDYLWRTRDPERTPMQWDDTENAGFSTNPKIWLPVNPNYWEVNVASENKAHTSHLKVFKAMAAARNDPILRLGDTSVLVPNNDTLAVVRTYKGKWFALIINMGIYSATYTTENFFAPNKLDVNFEVVTSSLNVDIQHGLKVNKGSANIKLRPDGAVLLRSQ